MNSKDVQAILPLSPMQQGMLFHELYQPGHGTYVVQWAITLEGFIDLEILEACWQSAVDRHPSLRAAFDWKHGKEPIQIFFRKAVLPCERNDHRGIPAGEQDRMFESLLVSDRLRGFDLKRAPLMRLTSFRLAEESCRIILTFHHLILDGWSFSLVRREVLADYEARVGRAQFIPPERRHYRDYLTWLTSKKPNEAENFWRDLFSGFDGPCRIGTPFSHPSGARIRELDLFFDRSVLERLRRAARTNQITLNTIMQAAWALSLSQLIPANDVVFGVVVSGRPAEIAGADQMIGLFINTVPVRIRVRPDIGVREWLQEQQERFLSTLQFQYQQLSQVQAWAGSPGGESLFDSLFVFENYPVDSTSDHESVKVTGVHVVDQTTYALTASVELGSELKFHLEYDEARLSHETTDSLLGLYQFFLNGLSGDSNLKLFELITTRPLAGSSSFQHSTRQEPQYSEVCLHDLIARKAAETPDAIAAILLARGVAQHLTYKSLDQQADQLARQLRSMEIGVGSVVSILVERSFDLLVTIYAILKTGAAYLPLDAGYPTARLEKILSNAEAQLVLATSHLAHKLQGTTTPVVCLDQLRLTSDPESSESLPVGLTPEHTAYIMYTSGTAGESKGVVVPHRALLNFSMAAVDLYGLRAGDRMLQSASPGFDISVEEIFPTLLAGATLVMCQGLGSLAFIELRRAIELCHITVVDLSTPYWHAWISALADSSERLPLSLRLVIIGGDEASRTACQLWQSINDRGISLINTYGPTETTVVATAFRVENNGAMGDVPIGRPIHNNIAVHVLDQQLQVVPVGVPGELYIGGFGVARGYQRQPALTAEYFLPDPFCNTPGARLYRTGDRVRLSANGELVFLGRTDKQVKIRGFRLELSEVKHVLLDCPQVSDAVVKVVSTKSGDRRLAAYVVPRDLSTFDPGSLLVHLRDILPKNMIPDIIVPLPSFPLTPHGKIDDKVLPLPEFQVSEITVSIDHKLQALTALLASVLELLTVGPDDDFFSLGGNSLLALQLAARIQETFGVELPLRLIFENPTVNSLAQELDTAASRSALPPITQSSPEQTIRLSAAQQRLWHLTRVLPGVPFFNMPVALRVRGPLEVPALRESFVALAARHEILRYTFVDVNGSPQVRLHLEPPEVPFVDFSKKIDPESSAAALVAEDARWPFNLEEEPGWRCGILRLGADHHVILITMHHLISDGYSFEILGKELSVLYETALLGTGPAQAAVPMQYRYYTSWQQRCLEEDAFDLQLSYWLRQLSGPLTPLALPIDKPEAFGFEYRTLRHRLDDSLVESIRRFGAQGGVTIFMVLLTALMIVLAQFAADRDVRVGLLSANRSRHPTREMIGLFINTLVIRVACLPNLSFREILRRVRRTLMEAYANDDVPYESVLSALSVQPELRENPLFQVLVVSQQAGETTFLSQGLTVEPFASPNDGDECIVGKVALLIEFQESPSGITLIFKYRMDLFSDSVARTLLDEMSQVLHEGVR